MDHSSLIVKKLQDLHPLIQIGLATTLVWLGLSYYNSDARKLRQFPTVGSTLPLLSLIGTIEFIKNVHNLLAIGMQKWPGRIFKIPATAGWRVVITDPKHIDDIRRAPDHKLCPRKPNEQDLQTRFTFGRKWNTNPLQFAVIKTRLTRSLPALVPGVYDEVVEACSQYLPAKDEWASVKALEIMTNIVARASNRVFVGPILCKNPDWIEIAIGYTLDVVKTAFILRLFPPFLRPFVNYFVSSIPQRNRQGMKLLQPIIAARRDEKMKGGTIPEDFLTWVMDEAQGEDKEAYALLERMLRINFAAIHTSSMTVTQVLFDLAANPEYLKPLREEVEEVTKREGWTKSGVDQMYKLDSFLKESQRFHPIAILSMNRYVLEDFTFSDGTTVPAGAVLCIPSNSIHFDPAVYEDPLKFDGFRFVKMKERAALDGQPGKKYEVVTVGSEFIAFGQGKHACPGRFFASAEIKLLLAHIITAYDVKLENGTGRPSDSVLMNANAPNRTAKVYFRKRQNDN